MLRRAGPAPGDAWRTHYECLSSRGRQNRVSFALLVFDHPNEHLMPHFTHGGKEPLGCECPKLTAVRDPWVCAGSERKAGGWALAEAAASTRRRQRWREPGGGR